MTGSIGTIMPMNIQVASPMQTTIPMRHDVYDTMYDRVNATLDYEFSKKLEQASASIASEVEPLFDINKNDFSTDILKSSASIPSVMPDINPIINDIPITIPQASASIPTTLPFDVLQPKKDPIIAFTPKPIELDTLIQTSQYEKNLGVPSGALQTHLIPKPIEIKSIMSEPVVLPSYMRYIEEKSSPIASQFDIPSYRELNIPKLEPIIDFKPKLKPIDLDNGLNEFYLNEHSWKKNEFVDLKPEPVIDFKPPSYELKNDYSYKNILDVMPKNDFTFDNKPEINLANIREKVNENLNRYKPPEIKFFDIQKKINEEIDEKIKVYLPSEKNLSDTPKYLNNKHNINKIGTHSDFNIGSRNNLRHEIYKNDEIKIQERFDFSSHNNMQPHINYDYGRLTNGLLKTIRESENFSLKEKNNLISDLHSKSLFKDLY